MHAPALALQCRCASGSITNCLSFTSGMLQVLSLALSDSGALLYTGGNEGVLVTWQAVLLISEC